MGSSTAVGPQTPTMGCPTTRNSPAGDRLPGGLACRPPVGCRNSDGSVTCASAWRCGLRTVTRRLNPALRRAPRVLSRLAYLTLAGTSSSLSPDRHHLRLAGGADARACATMHSSLTGRARRQRRASGPRRERVRREQPPGGAGHPQVRRGTAYLARPGRGRPRGEAGHLPPGRAPTRRAICDVTRRRYCAYSPTASSAAGSRSRGGRRSFRCPRRWTGWSTTTAASAGSTPTGTTIAAPWSNSSVCWFASRSTRWVPPAPASLSLCWRLPTCRTWGLWGQSIRCELWCSDLRQRGRRCATRRRVWQPWPATATTMRPSRA